MGQASHQLIKSTADTGNVLTIVFPSYIGLDTPFYRAPTMGQELYLVLRIQGE